MSKKEIIAVDIDDVIADSTESLRLRVNKHLGVELTKEHYQIPGEYWGYYERVWRTHGVEERLSTIPLDEEMEQDQLHVPLLAGASFALGELSKKYDIVLITARDASWEKATKAWLEHHFGDFFVGLHFSRSKVNAEHESKGKIAKSLGASWLIDDNPDHCRSAIDNGLEAILFGNYGWHTTVPDGVVRCKDWPEVLEHFNAR